MRWAMGGAVDTWMARAVFGAGGPLRRGPGWLALLALSACTGYGTAGLQVGDSAARVEQRMGPATGRHALPGGGQRLEFARGPMGLHTYMVDVDTQARVTRWEQVLSPAHFAAVKPGLSRQDLLLALGRPTAVRHFRRQNEEVWNYRYDNPLCRWFEVSLAIDGPVRAAYHAPDPRCEQRDDD